MRKKTRSKRKTNPLNRRFHAHAAGIDIAATEHVVAVPPGRGGENGDIRTFGSFTDDLKKLRDWLLACGIKTVAMESTANYWIPTFDILEEAGIDVWLVNARHAKGVPGRKTDVCDADWIQQLHSAGLLRKSFRPVAHICSLRYLMRHRRGLIQANARQIQLMQKALNEMNLQLHHVISDIDGVSGQRIIQAILKGERDPGTLADLRDNRCRTPRKIVLKALEANYREEFLFTLKQNFESFHHFQEQILSIDQEIAQMVEAVQGQLSADEPLPPQKCYAKKGKPSGRTKNTPNFAIREQAWRIYGVDLAGIPGVGTGTLGVIISELGTTDQIKKAFGTPKRFASWMGLCPDNRISGGKILSSKTRRVANLVAGAFRLTAQALIHSDSALGDYCRKMKARLGNAEGITATAHKVARIVFTLITTREAYDDTKAVRAGPGMKALQIRNLSKRARKLGLQLVVAQPSTS